MRNFSNRLPLVTALLSLISNLSASEIGEIIPTIKLEAEKARTLLIRDLFYAESYSPRFEEHPYVSVDFDVETGSLALQTQTGFEGYAAVPFVMNDKKYHLPILSTVKPVHTFRHRPVQPPQFRMNVMGNFNSWNRSDLTMKDTDADGEYELEVALDPGQYLYQFVIDSSEVFDRENPNRIDNGFGGFNSVLDVRPIHAEKTYLHILGHQENADHLNLLFLYERERRNNALRKEQVFALLNNTALSAQSVSISGDTVHVTLPDSALMGKTTIRIAVSVDGLSTSLQTLRLIDGKLLNSADFSTWQDAIIYSIIIDRFLDGDSSNTSRVQHDSLLSKANYFGGDLAGILQKIEEGYFDSLGVNTLWISPVVENTDHAYREWPQPHRFYSGYHGYWPTDHQKVETRFGDMALLRTLIAKAHERDINVLLDFVANHVHEEHPFFLNHREWFGTYELPNGRKNIRLWDEYRLTTWFEPFMPSFDYEKSQTALEVMTDNAVWWLEQTGADGFRHDAVKHVPNSFWRLLTRKLNQQLAAKRGRHIYQIGETFGGYDLVSSYVNPGQLSGQFNFNLYDVALPVFLNAESSFQTLAKELHKTAEIYGTQHLMGNVMDSHDKVRYMAYADGDLTLNSSDAKEIGWREPPQVDHATSYEKAKLYLIYLLTIPGVPIIYYGDEIGLTGADDPDNRRMMRFGADLTEQETAMLRAVRELVRFRRAHSALRYGDFLTLAANEDYLVYLRSDLNERILVILNKSTETLEVSFQLPGFLADKEAVQLQTGERVQVSQTMQLTIPGISGQLFQIK